VARLKILIAGRSKLAVQHLNKTLSGRSEFVLSTRILGNGHADPLQGVSETPDMLLLHHAPGQGELQFLAESGPANQLPLIVCGPGDSPESMRLAMQAGARDYLPENAPHSDLVASLLRLREETVRSGASASGQLIVVMNGKGGSGASFLATNLAHVFAVKPGAQATLVDLDIQFGGLCRYLDITPKVGILQALEVAKQMDDMSAEAYTCEHSSGLRLLAAPSKRFVSPNDIPTDQLDALLRILLSMNDYVIADSPNRLDAVTEFFLERADDIVLVVQQSLPSVQDAARMIQLLTSEIAISKDRISVVVNRFTKNAAVELSDIRKALHMDNLITIPNQYKLAAESINSGIPVAELSKNAPLTKGVRNLQTALEKKNSKSSKPADNFLTRALPSILRS
jgi:pilus assembly protein CpaE